MGATLSTDLGFEPKVFADHVQAYFRQKLMWGAAALVDETLTAQPGQTVHFPYFKKIGDAEEPAETNQLQVDKLIDDAFTCTVKEVGKAVGFTMRSFRASAARREEILAEAERQMARVHAEKVDKDLVALLANSANYTQGYTATAAANTLNIRSLNSARIGAFGDKHDEAAVVIMHSRQFLDMMNDSTAGFLKADANDPLWQTPGFQGRILGMAVLVSDLCPQVTDIDGADAFAGYIMKSNPYGICVAERPEVESDKDILSREIVVTATQYYGVVGLHKKVSNDDVRVARFTTTVSSL
jgi:N4-gp56 family major capsid protein